MKKYSKEIQDNLIVLCKYFDKEDRTVRETQIRKWKKYKYYWEGFQRIWWDELAHDWRNWDAEIAANDPSSVDSGNYDKQINIFKAYLESIIAALSIVIPSVNCVPDDADDPLDIVTAKTGNVIQSLIQKHNNASLLWLHALFIMCTEGLVWCYNYTKEDESYGTYEEPKYDNIKHTITNKICPICQTNIFSVPASNEERDEFDPDEDDVVSHDLLKEDNLCPQCLVQVDPELQEDKFTVRRQVGTTTQPKSRQCLEVYGGLFIKTPIYAKKQKDMPYLCFSYETSFVNVIERYPDLSEDLRNQRGGSSIEPYERWGRLSTQYRDEYPNDTPTVKNWWLRPASFNYFDQDVCKELKKEFPDGVKVVLIGNDKFAEAIPESLDDHWTATENPLADYMHHEPLGKTLVTSQDITNDLLYLTLETIQHGIPQTFADPNVLDFEQYRQAQAAPGNIMPAIPRSGKSMQEAFYEVKTANLSAEVMPFSEQNQQMAQLASGALPSLFGGAQANSSKTAAQYSMSRAQAQQRLQNQWKTLSIWWKEVFGKVIPAYIKELAYDEKFVTKDNNGNFVNVFIRRAELAGKIGSYELESSETLPATWQQKKDIILQMLQSPNPAMFNAITSPENLPLVTEALGLNEFQMPGEDDRTKQYEEIQLLLNTEPIPSVQPDPMTGMPQQIEVSSVQPDPVDNHEVQAEICRSWAVSDAGRLAKIENPNGYKNVLLHWQAHMAMIPPPMPQGNAGPQNKNMKPALQPQKKGNNVPV